MKGDVIMNGKTLCKSKDNRVLTGVCAGVAEYFGWDPTVVRVGIAVLSMFSGVGIVAYIIAAVVMPEQSDDDIIDM